MVCGNCDSTMETIRDGSTICWVCTAIKGDWCLECMADTSDLNEVALCPDCRPTTLKQFLVAREQWDERILSFTKRLAKLAGMKFARDFSKFKYDANGNTLYMDWSEYFRGEWYSIESLQCPLEFLDLTDEEISGRISEVKFEEKR